MSAPYGRYYLLNHRNDYIRWVIFGALKQGSFDFGALHILINAVLDAEGIDARHHISENGLRTMLNRNCEGAWDYDNGFFSATPNYCGSLSVWNKERGLGCIYLIMDKMIREGELGREKGKGLLWKT